MIRRTLIARMFAAAAAALAITGTASAGISPVSVTVTPQAGNLRGAYAGERDRNIVDPLAPGLPSPVDPPAGVPEPATLALAGIGLPLLAAFRRFRNKQ